MFSMLLILGRASLDIEKICQISNIAYVQNSDNKYYMGNDIFISFIKFLINIVLFFILSCKHTLV